MDFNAYCPVRQPAWAGYSNSPVHEWDIVAPHFFCQHGELSLASSTKLLQELIRLVRKTHKLACGNLLAGNVLMATVWTISTMTSHGKYGAHSGGTLSSLSIASMGNYP